MKIIVKQISTVYQVSVTVWTKEENKALMERIFDHE